MSVSMMVSEKKGSDTCNGEASAAGVGSYSIHSSSGPHRRASPRLAIIARPSHRRQRLTRSLSGTATQSAAEPSVAQRDAVAQTSKRLSASVQSPGNAGRSARTA